MKPIPPPGYEFLKDREFINPGDMMWINNKWKKIKESEEELGIYNVKRHRPIVRRIKT